MESMRFWWKEVTVYQIYPRSFADSNGDGIGDLKGVESKLDYLKKLGVDVIWLCPIYESPDVDNGYDISDYRKISKKFGTMADFDSLLSEVHKRGMKLMMDAVFNHTSDQHEWFKKSRKSKTGRYRKYYFWRKSPNNWESMFGGSAWERDRRTGEHYLHMFAKQQPDLNWDNRQVRDEIYKIIKWWLDKGVDGFRFDVINFISKVPGLPDGKVTQGQKYANGEKYYKNGPNINRYLAEMDKRAMSKYDVMSVGETAAKLSDINATKKYVNWRRHELNMVFHENNHIESSKRRNLARTVLERKSDMLKWDVPGLKRNFTMWQKGLSGDCWDSIYLGNHDYPRIVSRFGDDKNYRIESAKMIATMLFTLRGTPYIYQGEEIGMTNIKLKSIGEFDDVSAKNMYKEYIQEHKNSEKRAIGLLNDISRDNARTPMQWNRSSNAGFTSGKPWMRINPNYSEINVQDEFNDRSSVLSYYRRLIKLRKANKTLIYGKYRLIPGTHPKIYAYTREEGGERFLIILNFSSERPTFKLPGKISAKGASLLISNYEVEEDLGRFALRPYEARVYRLSES